MPKKRTVVRDAGTGRFVKESEASRRPDRTVKETVPTPKPKRRK